MVAYRPDEVQVRLRPDQDAMDVLQLGQCIDPRSMTGATGEEDPQPVLCLMILDDEPDFESMPRLESWPRAPPGTESGCLPLEPVLHARGVFVYPDGYPGVFVHIRFGLSEWLAGAKHVLNDALLEAAAKGALEDVPADIRERWIARARGGGTWFVAHADGSLELRIPAPETAYESTVHKYLEIASPGEEAWPAAMSDQPPELRTEAGEVVLLWRPNERGRFVSRCEDSISDPDSELARRARKARHPVRLEDVEARLDEP